MSQRCHELIAERWGKKVSGTSGTAELGYWSTGICMNMLGKLACKIIFLCLLSRLADHYLDVCHLCVSTNRGDRGATWRVILSHCLVVIFASSQSKTQHF